MYHSTTINQSVTVRFEAGEDFTDAAFLAVKLDTDGKAVLAGAGDTPVGIIPGGVEDTVKTGGDLSVQIKDMGLCKAGAAIAAGAFVSCGADGKCVTATDGAPILGQAITAADAAEQVIQVQLLKGGFFKAAAGA